ncbi:MAG: caspase family protein, partial [bacterium]
MGRSDRHQWGLLYFFWLATPRRNRKECASGSQAFGPNGQVSMAQEMKSNLYGLFVGVNEYESQDIRPLAFASKDVLSVRDKLAEVCGLQLENTVVLADNTENGASPTRRTLLRAMHRFASAPMQEDDVFVFVFAGHGFSCGGRTFLAAKDSEIASGTLLRETAVSLETVRDFLAQIPAGQHVLILDACRDAPRSGTRSVGAGGMSKDMTRDIGAVVEASPETERRNRRATAVLCSCWEGQVAHEYPGAAHGWFCYNLLEELGNSTQAEVSLSQLYRRTRRRMQQSAWRLLPAASDQAPHLLIDGDIPTLPVSALIVADKVASPSADAEAVTSAPEYCGVCGSSLAEEQFRCTRCGKVCCLT